MTRRGYELGTVARNKATRLRKAKKIIRLLSHEKDLKETTILEIGTGAGYIAKELSKVAKSVLSVDIVDDRKVKTGFHYSLVTNETLPFRDGAFDIVITNHVLEHVPDQMKHLSEMRRVLRRDGLVYLASPNKWWITDPHYKLPFISWLPRPVADKYLALMKGKRWDIYSVSRRDLGRLAMSAGFTVSDRLWMIIDDPAAYDMKQSPLLNVAKKTPKWFRGAILHVVPTHLVLLLPAAGKPRQQKK